MQNFDILERLDELGWTQEDLISRIAQTSWWHTFDLGYGIITPGEDKTEKKLEALHLPRNLSGRSVIDVGTFDGFFAFECEKRGADRVVASDWHAWNMTGRSARSNFRLIHQLYDSKVEELECRVEDLSEDIGTFDLVLFLGVLYHSPDPLGYLKKMRSLCRGICVLETHLDALEVPYPAVAFYEGGSFSGDPTNFWGPNRLAVEAMLREAGFREVRFFADWMDGRTTSFNQERYTARAVFHAFV